MATMYYVLMLAIFAILMAVNVAKADRAQRDAGRAIDRMNMLEDRITRMQIYSNVSDEKLQRFDKQLQYVEDYMRAIDHDVNDRKSCDIDTENE